MQADLVLEEPRVLYLDPQAAKGDCVHSGQSLSVGDLKATPTVTHVLQQGHTYSNKTTLLIVPLPMGQAFKHTSLGAILTQTTTKPN